MQLVGPVGGDHEQRLVAERRGEEAQERARRRVRPVQVLDHEQHRRLARERRRAPRAAPRTRAPGRRRRARSRRGAEAGQQRRELGADLGGQLGEHGVAVAHERAQRRDERRVGSSPSPSSTQSPRSTRVPSAAARPSQLGHEAALADARLADHERERRLPGGGVGERRLELRQLERARPTRSIEVTPVAIRLQDRRARGLRRLRAGAGARPPGRSAAPRRRCRSRAGTRRPRRRCSPSPRPGSQPVDEPLPVGAPEQDDREVADLAGLAQRGRLEQLVERAEPAREDDERARVAHEHDLAREEVVEVEADVDVRVLELLVRQLDVEPDRRWRRRRARRGCRPP